jgi:lipoic acid synthetase
VIEFVHPDAFARHQQTAEAMGFIHVASGPMVRSSYHADEFPAGGAPR